MKKTALVSMAVSLGLASLPVNAAKPHPVSEYSDLGVSCTCDWLTEPSTCTVTWRDAGAPTYGVSIELEAEWDVNGVTTSSKAKLDLNDNWACDSATCSASGEFALPYYDGDATITFDGKVKAFNNGRDGVTPRNFAKETGACNLPGSGQSLDDVDDPVIDPSQY